MEPRGSFRRFRSFSASWSSLTRRLFRSLSSFAALTCAFSSSRWIRCCVASSTRPRTCAFRLSRFSTHSRVLSFRSSRRRRWRSASWFSRSRFSCNSSSKETLLRPGWQELANFRKPYKTSRTRAAPGGRRAIPRSQPQVGSREYVVRFFGVRRVSRRGGFHLSQFERPDTAGLVRRRLAENAQDVDALFVLAAIQARAGRLAEGLTILDHVLRLDPTYPG